MAGEDYDYDQAVSDLAGEGGVSSEVDAEASRVAREQAAGAFASLAIDDVLRDIGKMLEQNPPPEA